MTKTEITIGIDPKIIVHNLNAVCPCVGYWASGWDAKEVDDRDQGTLPLDWGLAAQIAIVRFPRLLGFLVPPPDGETWAECIGDLDASDGDNFIQLAAFGKLVYG